MSLDNDTSRMEDVLKRALHAQPAPDGFADRVLARLVEENSAESERGHRDSRWLVFTQPTVRWATAAALAAALVAGGLHYRQVQYEKAERAQGEAAKQRLMLALRIASSKLQLAKSKVNEINADQTGNRQEKE